ncbi:hypothetical protein RB595_009583 [Gaeumannomyces hyphopodioides]
MPPIPIYTKSPINANKASGVTPQTAAGEAEKQPAPQAPPATTTAAASSQPTRTSEYPPAQPGAVPSIPAPTGSLTGPAGPPPAPQPGAVPHPPRAGETYQPPAAPEPTAAPQYPPPPQMSIPSPVAPLHYGGTATATGPLPGRGNTGVTQLPASRAAGTGTSTSIYPHPNNAISSPYAGQYQAYEAGTAAPSDDDQGEGVWDSAKKYMQAAGSKLSAAESEVWKRINKQ